MVVAYNGTGMTGGSSVTQDLNIWYDVSSNLTAFDLKVSQS